MRFASLDVYPKTLQEFRQRTLTGAIVSITTVTLIVLLAAVEIIDFAQLKTHEHLYVDTSRGQQLRINVNITFPALPCSVIQLDTLDLSGNHAPDQARTITKTQLNAKGERMSQASQERHPHGMGPGRQLLFTPGQRQGQGQQPGPRNGAMALLSQRASRGDALLSALLSELLPNVFEDKDTISSSVSSPMLRF